MTEYQITCVIQKNGVITDVGIGGKLYSVSQIAEWRGQGWLFFTNKGGYKAYVERRWSSVSNRWYLTTDPDSTRENNLDFLPSCN